MSVDGPYLEPERFEEVYRATLRSRGRRAVRETIVIAVVISDVAKISVKDQLLAPTYVHQTYRYGYHWLG